MAYIIYNNDSTVLLTLADGEIDTATTDLTLVGKNVNNYGQYINNNLTKLLTNFSSSVEPERPLSGQLWYDDDNKILKVFNGTTFETAFAVSFQEAQPATTSTGELWYDTNDQQLRIWNSSTFALIGPAVSPRLGKFGVEPAQPKIFEDEFDEEQNVSALYSYTIPTALITTATFQMSVSSSTYYLGTATTSTVVKGITVLNDLDIRGNLYVRGRHMHDKNLTAYYDITWAGDIKTGTTSTNQTRIDATNNVLRLKLLPNLFSTATFALGSEVKVICAYNTATSIRHFVLKQDGLPHIMWDPVNTYYNSYTTMNNNIVYQE